MKTLVALVVSLAFITLPLAGVAADKQITDVKELAGSWEGWVASQTGGLERATMIIKQDGSYQASTRAGTQTVGKYYLDGGKLRYQSSLTSGSATVSEDKGKTFLTVIPEGTAYPATGKTQYERKK
jgi:hypothetical protein